MSPASREVSKAPTLDNLFRFPREGAPERGMLRLGEGLTPRSSSVMLVRRLIASASGPSARKELRLRSKMEEPETEVAEGDAGRAGGRPREEEGKGCIFI